MPDKAEWIPIESDYERVAAHEAGHAVVGLSVGAKIDYIERLATDGVPAVLQAEDFYAGLAVNFTISVRKLEPRLQYLIAVGGMAAETLNFGAYNRGGAASDLENLKPAGLTETQINGLIEISQKLLIANLPLFNRLRESLQARLSSQEKMLVAGASLNSRFNKTGKKVDIGADLDRLLSL